MEQDPLSKQDKKEARKERRKETLKSLGYMALGAALTYGGIKVGDYEHITRHFTSDETIGLMIGGSQLAEPTTKYARAAVNKLRARRDSRRAADYSSHEAQPLH